MNKKFKRAQVQKCISDHEALKNSLIAGRNAVEKYRNEIKASSDSLIEEELIRILSSIPVEELNRNKNGFRIKSLKDSGYNTIADIAFVSAGQIDAIYGISEESAAEIVAAVDSIVKETRKAVQIRISSDSRTPGVTRLVNAVSYYARSVVYSEACQEILNTSQEIVEQAVEDLKPATTLFRWIFTFGSSRKRALTAFELLTGMLTGEYGENASRAIAELDAVLNSDELAGWNFFNTQTARFFSIVEEINPGFLSNDDVVYGLPEELADSIKDQKIFTEGLNCQLRRYQEWGVKYILHQEKVLLGDEMGLGKTVQAIAAMVSLKNTGSRHFLVICPASVLSNWCREISKMSNLNAVKIFGADRMTALEKWICEGGAAVTTYETTGFVKFSDDFAVDMVIVDEAHYIKNPKAKRSENTRRICSYAKNILFMTGTALENRVDEMISLIGILRPETAAQVKEKIYLSDAPKFRESVAHVYYRRKREDVLRELPELIEKKEWCTMTPEDIEAYSQALNSRNYSDIRRVSWNHDNLSCSSKAQRLLDIAEEAAAEDRKVIVFSFFRDTVSKITELLGDRCLEPVTGSVSPERRQEIIDEFDRAPSGTVLPLQITAGGTGLNIQSASVVVICEPQFKPSVENQAISRAYRMGQTRNVIVYRLLCDNSVDEHIVDILENKQNIFDAYADKSEAAQEMTEIDDKLFSCIAEREAARMIYR